MSTLTGTKALVIERAVEQLRIFLARECERFYEHTVFSPRFPGDTPEEKFAAIWGTDTTELIEELEALL